MRVRYRVDGITVELNEFANSVKYVVATVISAGICSFSF